MSVAQLLTASLQALRARGWQGFGPSVEMGWETLCKGEKERGEGMGVWDVQRPEPPSREPIQQRRQSPVSGPPKDDGSSGKALQGNVLPHKGWGR